MNSNSKRYRCLYSSCVFSLESYFNLAWHELKCRHKKDTYADRYDKRGKDIISEYGNQVSGPEGRASDTLYQGEGSYSPAAEALTITEEDDDFVSEQISIFVTEFANIILRY